MWADGVYVLHMSVVCLCLNNFNWPLSTFFQKESLKYFEMDQAGYDLKKKKKKKRLPEALDM